MPAGFGIRTCVDFGLVFLFLSIGYVHLSVLQDLFDSKLHCCRTWKHVCFVTTTSRGVHPRRDYIYIFNYQNFFQQRWRTCEEWDPQDTCHSSQDKAVIFQQETDVQQYVSNLNIQYTVHIWFLTKEYLRWIFWLYCNYLFFLVWWTNEHTSRDIYIYIWEWGCCTPCEEHTALINFLDPGP